MQTAEICLFVAFSLCCVFGYHYRCNLSPGITRLLNDLSCVNWDPKLLFLPLPLWAISDTNTALKNETLSVH